MSIFFEFLYFGAIWRGDSGNRVRIPQMYSSVAFCEAIPLGIAQNSQAQKSNGFLSNGACPKSFPKSDTLIGAHAVLHNLIKHARHLACRHLAGGIRETGFESPINLSMEFCEAKLLRPKSFGFWSTEQGGFEPPVPFRGTTP